MKHQPFFVKHRLTICLALLLAIATDQISKWLVETLLPLHKAVEILPFLFFFRTYNTGIAFSFFAQVNGWLIVGMRLIVVAIVLFIWRSVPHERFFSHIGFTLVIAGAIGNLIDRFAYGHVIDFIFFHAGDFEFAVFNLADSFITIGAILVILDEIIPRNRKKK